jgi:hypothetical protein
MGTNGLASPYRLNAADLNVYLKYNDAIWPQSIALDPMDSERSLY